MSSRNIEIILKAKNAMAAGIASAGASLKAFGTSALNVGKALAGIFLTAGTSIAGFATVCLKSFAESEAAGNSLSAAFNANNEAGKELLPTFQSLATAIMEETGVSDESVVSGMARLKMLGVSTDKLEEASKATIALASVGLEGEAAQKAVAMAMQGNYTMLQRYVPALRLATSEEEKAAFVKDLFSKGYDVQKEKLQTLSGQWGMLKTYIGEATETIGGAIASNETLREVLTLSTQKVKGFGEAVSSWVDDGGVERWTYAATSGIMRVSATFQLMGNDVQKVWTFIKSNPFSYLIGVVNSFISTGIAGFNYLADVATSAWEAIRTGSLDAFKKPDTSAMVAAAKEVQDALSFKDSREAVQDYLQDELRIKIEYAQRAADLDAKYAETVEKLNQKRLSGAKKTASEMVAVSKVSTGEVVDFEEDAEGDIEETYDGRLAKFKEVQAQILETERANADSVVSINDRAADNVVDSWNRVAKAKEESASTNVFDLRGDRFKPTFSAGVASSSISDFMNRPSVYESIGASRQSLTAKSSKPFASRTQGEMDIVTELKMIREKQESLLRMG